MRTAILFATGAILTTWATPSAANLLGDLVGTLPSPQPAPEISPESLRGAFALVVGGLVILGDRLRRR
jgi:hypothetical protein